MLDQIRNCRKSNNHNKEWLCAPSGEVMSGEHGEEHEGVAAAVSSSKWTPWILRLRRPVWKYWEVWRHQTVHCSRCSTVSPRCRSCPNIVTGLSKLLQSCVKCVTRHHKSSEMRSCVSDKSKQCHKTQDWWGPCAGEQLYPVTKTVRVGGNVE